MPSQKREDVAFERVYSGAWSHERDVALTEAIEYDPNGEIRVVTVASDELSDGFQRAFKLAGSTGWEASDFDRRLNGYLTETLMADERTDMTDLSQVWEALGDKLGFDSFLDNLAVIWDETAARGQNGGWLLAKTKEIVDGLRTEGHPHAAVVVFASELPSALENRIFEVGGQVIDVPKIFYRLDLPHRREFVKSLFPSVGPTPKLPAPGSKNPNPDLTQYIARNPDLSEDDVETWWNRLAAPLGQG